MDCHGCPESCQSQASKIGWNWLGALQKNTKRHIDDRGDRFTVALVGFPNVGKSSIFNLLTGAYATVSNYPGTTVEVSQGTTIINQKKLTVIDTPGMYSLLPITEEERVSRDLLFAGSVDLVIHVVDAKNLSRMLPLTVQLIETQLPVLLAVNTIDEAQKLGIWVDEERLGSLLGIPAVTMAAAMRVGVEELTNKIANYVELTCLSASH